jgi:TonB dependent receptor
MDFGFLPHSQLRIEAYEKKYRDIPASTEYPAVTMHTMIDMIGAQLVWLPMNSLGRGEASGIEFSDITRVGSRLQMQGSVAYSRAKFAGTDGILRPSNFDFPWIANLAVVSDLGRALTFSMRYGYATGRPYTPFSMSASMAQNRPIYDLAQVNVPRAPFYSRLDAQINKDFQIRTTHLVVYAGVDNLLNRSNFLSYAWMPRFDLRNRKRNPVGTLWQTPIFPNFGIRFVVR